VEWEGETPTIFVGNNEYYRQGLRLGRRQHLDEGKLSLIVFRDISRFELATIPMWALLGKLENERFHMNLTAQKIKITTQEPIPLVSLDGEVSWIASPLHYKIHSRALHVIVPQINVRTFKGG
jgi:diacylglycerol kinase family enzyme